MDSDLAFLKDLELISLKWRKTNPLPVKRWWRLLYLMALSHSLWRMSQFPNQLMGNFSSRLWQHPSTLQTWLLLEVVTNQSRHSQRLLALRELEWWFRVGEGSWDGLWLERMSQLAYKKEPLELTASMPLWMLCPVWLSPVYQLFNPGHQPWTRSYELREPTHSPGYARKDQRRRP